MSLFEVTFAESTTSKHAPVSTRRTLLAMLGMLVVALVLNLFLARFGIRMPDDDPSLFVPLLGPGFFALLPWWNLYLLLAFSFSIVLLLQRQWYPPLQWIRLGLSAYAMGLLIGMILAPALIGPAPAWFAQHDLSLESMIVLRDTVSPLGSLLARLLLAMALLVIVGRTGRLLSAIGASTDSSSCGENRSTRMLS